MAGFIAKQIIGNQLDQVKGLHDLIVVQLLLFLCYYKYE